MVDVEWWLAKIKQKRANRSHRPHKVKRSEHPGIDDLREITPRKHHLAFDVLYLSVARIMLPATNSYSAVLKLALSAARREIRGHISRRSTCAKRTCPHVKANPSAWRTGARGVPLRCAGATRASEHEKVKCEREREDEEPAAEADGGRPAATACGLGSASRADMCCVATQADIAPRLRRLPVPNIHARCCNLRLFRRRPQQ